MRKQTNYAGIDYSGPGATCNRDADLGIRYGVISQHSLDPDSMSDIWDNSEDLSHKAAVEELKQRFNAAFAIHTKKTKRAAFRQIIEDFVRKEDRDDVVRDLMEIKASEDTAADLWAVVEDRFNDRYECDDRDWRWEKDGYLLENCLQSDIFVAKSPYFTYATYCSPCVPGACSLDSPFEGLAVPSGDYPARAEDWKAEAESLGFAKCFCLGHDFFEDDKAPYEVFSVATGKQVVMVEKKEKCPNCNGLGRDTVSRLAEVRGCLRHDVLTWIAESPSGVQGWDVYTETFKCFRCNGAGHEIKKVEEEQ